jgi:hypothetical protein
MWLRSCPKCRGDLCLTVDVSVKYITCLQCSHDLTFTEIAALRDKTVAMRQGVAMTTQPVSRPGLAA